MIDGRYVVLERIGQGGMGSVFLADQPLLGRAVALKVLHPELVAWAGHTRRIRDEAMAACRVRHPHCVAVLDCSALPDGTPYIVMDHVPGRSLGRVIAEESIPLARAVDLVDQILAALAATHAAGVIHGDVKSDNFLVESVDGRDHVTLIDFGLARIAGTSANRDQEAGEVMVSGTPEYMAPEVIAGDAPVYASDLYGAGVILYELLTGSPPFLGATAREVMLRHADDDVVPPSQRRPDRAIPTAVDRVALRALDKQPGARFTDAAGFARELRAAAVTRTVVVRSPSRASGAAGGLPRDPGSPLVSGRVARGSDWTGRGADLARLRWSIGQAIMRGDVTGIANGYLALAGALGDKQRFAAAARELQEGIDLLMAGRGRIIPGARHPADRLIAELAALRDQRV